MCYLSDIMFQWRDCIGFSKYEVSTFGHIRHKKFKRILKNSFDKSVGYDRVCIRNDEGIVKTIRIHILLAKSFHSNYEKLEMIDHRDLNKQNNTYWNLHWVTRQENMDNMPELYKNNKSGKKYIYWCDTDKAWRISVPNKWRQDYRRFDSIEDAEKRLKIIIYNYNITNAVADAT